MNQKRWATNEQAKLRKAALRYVIPHFASNEGLSHGLKIFTRSEADLILGLIRQAIEQATKHFHLK